jgi:photosynthetic reaction center cytochrome c subunit
MAHAPTRSPGSSLVAFAAVLAAAGAAACDLGKKVTSQSGYRGTGMNQVYDSSRMFGQYGLVKIPTTLPPAGASPPGPLPWRNVQVLNDISVAEFNRTMVAMSVWVAGAGNCAYCHNVANFASDTTNNGRPLYTKLTARRMLQMTRHINGQYAAHVGNTGVTCYTCHQGKPQPNGLWYYTDRNQSLRHYLDREGARVASRTIQPTALNRSSVKQTEWIYQLMISQSQSLGVNCTYCHNSRAFSSWQEAPPARVKAYHGILMLRDVNSNYLAPLQPVYPAVRLGQMGDAPKAQCLTCHNGAYKPLYGYQMTKDYPALWGRSEWNGAAFPSVNTGGVTPATPAVPTADSASAAANGQATASPPGANANNPTDAAGRAGAPNATPPAAPSGRPMTNSDSGRGQAGTTRGGGPPQSTPKSAVPPRR